MGKPTKNEAPIERVAAQSPDLREELLAGLRSLAPEAFSEGKFDIEKLRSLAGDDVEDKPERFSFTWSGKRDAVAMLQVPTSATLVPDRANSIDYDDSRHVFIEGENLEVLKALYRAYYGRIKLIYIDPPYNTGNDFVYPDKFADPIDHYLRITGQKNGDGELLTSNAERGGRLHSAWLSMMYPRLAIARQLLKDDGVILVSIDDHEVYNLRRLMNELFGEENFLAQLVWEKGRKNDAKLFSVGHEYILVYARSLARLKELKTVWREPKPGAQEIWDKYLELRATHGADDGTIEQDLQQWYRDLPKAHPSKALSRYRHVDKYGPWRDRDISWPGGGGPRYDVPHPVTGLPCKVPEAGWRFPAPETMQRQIELGLVEFRETHEDPPFRKAHLRPVSEELDDNGEAPFDEVDEEAGAEDESTVGLQVMPSVIYKQSQVAVKYLKALMGDKVFDNPKDHEVLARLIRYVATGDDTILDFFGGSASTAEATLLANAQDGKNRRCIIVQLPEPVPAKSGAAKAGFKTIAELARERFKRAIAKLKDDHPTLFQSYPAGFRAFTLADSSVRRWKGMETKDADAYADQLDAFADTLVDGWIPENVIWEVALREGYALTSEVEKREEDGQTFWRVTDPEREQTFHICLDDKLTMEAVGKLGFTRESLFICRDKALDDSLAANLALQCRLKVL